MEYSKLKLILILGVIVLLAGTTITSNYDLKVQREIIKCDETKNSDSEKINCWFVVIQNVFLNQGTEKAFTVFESIYQQYDTFSDTGCHRHAHRVGDLAYYYDYLSQEDLTKTEFPKNAVACGYGFYHGFFEHLIQDNPDPSFVTNTCEYLREYLYEVAPAISQTCYHGAGHGFVLAELDNLTDSSEWSTSTFTRSPLQKCESLSIATESEISECRQGVYNVLADWMADNEYNLYYDTANPFAFCDAQVLERQYDCYYEMAQKIGIISQLSPIKAVEVAKKAKRMDLKSLVLDVAVAGMVQHNPNGSQIELLNECRLLTEDFSSICFKSIVGGLIEHNTIDDDFSSVFNFCRETKLSVDETSECYSVLADKLERFYTKEEIRKSCDIGVYPDSLCIHIYTEEL